MCQFFQTRFSNAPQAAAAPESQHTKSGVTVEDVEKVQMLVETCLQRFLTKEETGALLESPPYNIDSRFVSIIWQRLEKEKPEFFESYYKALIARQLKVVEI